MDEKINEYKIQVDKEFEDVDKVINDTKDYIDGAFKDGILTESEKEGIKIQINQIQIEQKDVEKQYVAIYNHSLLINKVTLKTEYDSYKSISNQLVDFLNSILLLTNIEIGHVNEKDRLFTLYKEKKSSFSERLNLAIDEIAANRTNNLNTKVEERFSTLNINLDEIKLSVGKNTTEITNTKENLNEVSDNINKIKTDFKNEINDVENSLSALNSTMNGAFKDGIISEAETKAINERLVQLDKEKTDLDVQYNAIITNSDLQGTAKINISNAKNDFNSKYTDLKSYIISAISDKKVTDVEKTNINTKTSVYNTALANLQKSFNEALDSISKIKADNAQTNANNHTDSEINKVVTNTNSKFSEIKATTDAISSKVEKVEETTTKINGQILEHNERIQTAEEKITPDAITETVTNSQKYKDDFGNVYTIEESNSKIEQKANEIKTSINGISPGNLIKNGDFEINLDDWSKNNTPTLHHSGGGVDGGQCLGIEAESGTGHGVYQYFNTIPGETYSVSCYCYLTFGDAYITIDDSTWVDFDTETLNKWHRITFKFTATSNSHFFAFYTNSSGRTLAYIDKVMINKGSMALDYVDKSPSQSYVEQQLNSNSIINKVSEGLNNGTNIKGTSTELTKDKFAVTHTNNKSKVEMLEGNIYTYDSNGNPCFSMVNTDLYVHDWDRPTRLPVGKIISGKSLAANERHMAVLSEKYGTATVLGHANYDNGTVYSISLECRRGNTIIFMYANAFDVLNGDLRTKWINDYAKDTPLNIDKLLIRGNSINGEWKDPNGGGWLRANLWNSSMTVFGDGSGNGNNYGNARAATFQNMKAAVEMNNRGENIGVYHSSGVTQTVSDIGHSIIEGDGKAIILLEHDFLEFADTVNTYFISYEVVGSPNQVYTLEKHFDYFIVAGEPGTEFSYRIEAKKQGEQALRYYNDFEKNKEIVDDRLDEISIEDASMNERERTHNELEAWDLEIKKDDEEFFNSEMEEDYEL